MFTEQNSNKPNIFYQLLTSPDPDPDTPEIYRTVYSVLALDSGNDNVHHHFIYDISRKKDTAEKILDLIRSAMPDISFLNEFISENL